jgi:hypothetical protein
MKTGEKEVKKDWESIVHENAYWDGAVMTWRAKMLMVTQEAKMLVVTQEAKMLMVTQEDAYWKEVAPNSFVQEHSDAKMDHQKHCDVRYTECELEAVGLAELANLQGLVGVWSPY